MALLLRIRHPNSVAVHRIILLHPCVLGLLALIENLLELLEDLVLSHVGLACRHGIVLHHPVVLLHGRILLALTSATELVLRVVVLLAALLRAFCSQRLGCTGRGVLCLRVLPLKGVARRSADLVLLRDGARREATLTLHHQAIAHFLVAHRH